MTKGTLTVVTDLRHDEMRANGDAFVLSCSNPGLPEQTATRADLRLVDGCVVLRFERLCPSSSYTLRARLADGTDERLFEDVAYAELTGLSEAIDEHGSDPWS